MGQEGWEVTARGARGNGRIYPRGEVLWVAYHLRGKKIRDSTGASVGDEKAAEKFLRNRLKEVHADELGARTFTTPKARRLTVHDLLEASKRIYSFAGSSVRRLLRT